MKCPHCETVDLSISERKNVEIDFCPKCRGVWLDRGELDKIIELSIGDAPDRTIRASDDRPREDDRSRGYEDDPRYKKRKRESFLSELFDF